MIHSSLHSCCCVWYHHRAGGGGKNQITPYFIPPPTRHFPNAAIQKWSVRKKYKDHIASRSRAEETTREKEIFFEFRCNLKNFGLARTDDDFPDFSEEIFNCRLPRSFCRDGAMIDAYLKMNGFAAAKKEKNIFPPVSRPAKIPNGEGSKKKVCQKRISRTEL